MNIKLEIDAKKRQESRDIVKKILEFGVTEQQKIDIIYFISMSLENNINMKEITNFINKFRKQINNDQKIANNNNTNNKIIT